MTKEEALKLLQQNIASPDPGTAPDSGFLGALKSIFGGSSAQAATMSYGGGAMGMPTNQTQAFPQIAPEAPPRWLPAVKNYVGGRTLSATPRRNVFATPVDTRAMGNADIGMQLNGAMNRPIPQGNPTDRIKTIRDAIRQMLQQQRAEYSDSDPSKIEIPESDITAQYQLIYGR